MPRQKRHGYVHMYIGKTVQYRRAAAVRKSHSSVDIHAIHICYECWNADMSNGTVDQFKTHQG